MVNNVGGSYIPQDQPQSTQENTLKDQLDQILNDPNLSIFDKRDKAEVLIKDNLEQIYNDPNLSLSDKINQATTFSNKINNELVTEIVIEKNAVVISDRLDQIWKNPDLSSAAVETENFINSLDDPVDQSIVREYTKMKEMDAKMNKMINDSLKR